MHRSSRAPHARITIGTIHECLSDPAGHLQSPPPRDFPARVIAAIATVSPDEAPPPRGRRPTWVGVAAVALIAVALAVSRWAWDRHPPSESTDLVAALLLDLSANLDLGDPVGALAREWELLAEDLHATASHLIASLPK